MDGLAKLMCLVTRRNTMAGVCNHIRLLVLYSKNVLYVCND